jgi:hypothetical protein
LELLDGFGELASDLFGWALLFAELPERALDELPRLGKQLLELLPGASPQLCAVEPQLLQLLLDLAAQLFGALPLPLGFCIRLLQLRRSCSTAAMPSSNARCCPPRSSCARCTTASGKPKLRAITNA